MFAGMHLSYILIGFCLLLVQGQDNATSFDIPDDFDPTSSEFNDNLGPISLRHHHENQLNGVAFGLPPWYKMISYNVETGAAFQIDQVEKRKVEQQEALEMVAAEREAAQRGSSNGAGQGGDLADYDMWG